MSLPIIFANNIIVSESESYADFVLMLSAPSTQTVSVEYGTLSETASDPTDYAGVTPGVYGSTTVEFAPGETTKTLRVPLINDSAAENIESFSLFFYNPVNAEVANQMVQATIVDNDAATGVPVIQLGDVVVDETDGRVYLTLILDKPSADNVTLSYSTASSTATAGQDFVGQTAQSLVFTAGQTTKTIAIDLIDDSIAEGFESFDVLFSSITGASMPDPQARISIGASDQTPFSRPVIHASASAFIVGEGDGYADFVLSLSTPSTESVMVDYGISSETATDYQSSFDNFHGTKVFAPGETTKTVRIGIYDGNQVESLEPFYLELYNPVNAQIANDKIQAPIVDNHASAGTPVIQVGDVVVDESAGQAYLTLLLDRPSADNVTFSYSTASGTSTAGQDFVGQAAQSLVFTPGHTTWIIAIDLVDDDTAEGVESFAVLFSSITGATMPTPQARISIGASDQIPASPPVIEANNLIVSESEGYADFVLTLSAPSTETISVQYSTHPATAGDYWLHMSEDTSGNDGTDSGTGNASADYVGINRTAVFFPGETTKTIRIPLIADSVAESNETFYLSLDNQVNALVGNNWVEATIIDNDSASGTPLVQIGDVVVDESAGRTYLTLTLDKPSAGNVTLSYSTAPGTATAGQDFVGQTAQTVAFTAGQTARTIAIDLVDNSAAEGVESFDVVFSDITGATMPDPQARVTIGTSDQTPVSTPVIEASNIIVGESEGYADFVLSLSAPSTKPVGVYYTTTAETVSVPNNYAGIGGYVFFAPGETTKTIRVALTGDSTAENLENFYLSLYDDEHIKILATIVDNDAAPGTPAIQVGDVIVDESAGRAYLTLVLDKPSTSNVALSYSTASGTATADQDFVGQMAQTVAFAAGQTAKTIAIDLVDDNTAEGIESFDVLFSSITGATMLDPLARVTIGASDQTPVSTPVIKVSNIIVGEGDGYADFVFTLSAPSVQTVSVNYGTANETASSSDFHSTSGSIVFSPGETTRTLRVAIDKDTTEEWLESFYLNLDSPVNAIISNNAVQAGIVVNDGAVGTPVIRVGDVVVDETDGRAYLTLILDTPSADDVTLSYSTASGTATAGQDFVGQTSQSLVFTAGQTAKTIAIDLIDDNTAEGIESFDVLFSNITGATMPDPLARVTIGASDQTPVSTPVIKASNIIVGEGDGYADFVLTLSAPLVQSVSVNYGTSSETAQSNIFYYGYWSDTTSNSDFYGSYGTTVFAPGETTKTVRIAIHDDAQAESLENFYLSLSSPVNAQIANNVVQATIVDNDATAGTPVIRVGDVVVDESAGRAYLTLILDKPSTGNVTLSYSTASGTATAGQDFVGQTAQTVAFTAGQTAKTIAIDLIDDNTAEGIESFDVLFANITGATMPAPQARVTIGTSDQPTAATPVIHANHLIAGEGDSYADFVLTLSAPSTQSVSVDYGIWNEASASYNDFYDNSGTAVFAPGETTKTVRIAIYDDAQVESLENFYLSLSSPVNAQIANNKIQATIVDNDATAGRPVIQVGDVIVDETDRRAYLTLTLDKPSTGNVTLSYSTASGTATAGQDFVGQTAQTVAFTAGQTAKTIAIDLIDDNVAEGIEYFDVLFSNITGATMPDPQGRVVIASADVQGPWFTVSFPNSGAANVQPEQNIVLLADEPIVLGTGKITIKTASGAVVEYYDVDINTANLGISGNILTIDPSNDLQTGTSYTVEFGASSIKDAAGKSLAALPSLSFSTTAANISGTDGDDYLVGTSGDDAITVGLGNDIVDAGAGTDTAELSMFPNIYHLWFSAQDTVSGTYGDYTIRLNSVDYVEFGTNFKTKFALSDLTSGMAQQKLGQLTDLYLAFFGRAPDTSGLEYWQMKLLQDGKDFDGIAKDFAWSTEAQALYPQDGSNRDFVEIVYQNCFNRSPDQGGWDYWTNRLDGLGHTDLSDRGAFVAEVILGAYAPTSGAEDRNLLTNRHEVAMDYVNHLATAPQENFDSSINELLTLVTADAATRSKAEAVIEYVFTDTITLTGIMQDQALFDTIWGA